MELSHETEGLLSLLAGAALPLRARAAAAKAPPNLKITDVQVVVTNPGRAPMGNFMLVKIVTSEPGLYGWGDATCTGSDLAVATFVQEHMRPALIGRDLMRLEDIWQTLFPLLYYRSGSVHMSALSGVDMALWDIKGKVAGLPVYELLGGRVRTKLLTYTSVSGRDLREVEEGCRRAMERDCEGLKVQVRLRGAALGRAARSYPEGPPGWGAAGRNLGTRALRANPAEVVRALAKNAGR